MEEQDGAWLAAQNERLAAENKRLRREMVHLADQRWRLGVKVRAANSAATAAARSEAARAGCPHAHARGACE